MLRHRNNEKGFSVPDILLAVLVVLIIAAVAGRVLLNHIYPGPPANWVSFSNTAGNFSVMFPNEPSALAQSNDSNAEKGFYASEGTTGFVVSYAAITRSDADVSASTVFKNSIGAEVSYTNGHITSAKKTTISSYQAETYQVVGSKNGDADTVTGEVVDTGKVVYNVAAFQINTISPNTQYFLKSFKVD